MARPKVQRQPPPKVDKDVGKTVWVNCRAKASCEGHESKITMKFKLQNGGNSIRYRCLTCNGVFHITL